jgi:Polyketide cyclase / dehydrase and lipid transport
MVDAPVERVWELIGDVNRHPEWWPRVEDVNCDLLEEGCTYRQVTRQPGKTVETTISIENLEDCHQLRLRCLDTGLYAHFLLTPAQNGTFVDGELGIEPGGLERLFAPVFVRRWIAQSLEGLRRAAVRQEPGDEGSEETPA